jgi:hypothetical protein
MEPSDLYGLPLERFTAERNALVRQLRRDGRRDQAAEVSKLRKPSVAAWAVNQLVRTQPRDLKALYDSGDALRKTQSEVLAGRSEPGSLRAAVEAERVAVRELVTRARGLLGADGHELSPAGLELVSETLHAAALDPDARALVSDGCLARELRHVGLGEVIAPSGPRRSATGAPKSTPPARPKPSTEARRAEANARRRLERTERELAAAEERRRRAESELEQAAQAVARARQARDEAAAERQRARDRLGGP